MIWRMNKYERYRQNHPDRVKDTQRRYYEKDPERRKAQWREFVANKKASMSPEELEASRLKKAEYDKAYRDKNREIRAAYKADPERRKRWSDGRIERHRLFRLANPLPPCQTPEERKAKVKVYHAKYKEENPNAMKEYYSENRESLLEKKKAYYQENRSAIIARNSRHKSNARVSRPELKAISACYCRISRLMKGVTKSKKTMQLIGCSQEYFLKHIQSLFKDGMTWENYGRKGWHLDHIRPCASFSDLTDPLQQQECFNYKNLQPMWGLENIKNGASHNGKRWSKHDHACNPPATMPPST